METISFELSQALLAALKIGSTELLQKMRLLAAIAYFQEKKLSLGKAAELAGINRLEFMDILAQKGIVIFDYDESEVDVEFSGIAHL
jgi:predicted HTH domain antitoxin